MPRGVRDRESKTDEEKLSAKAGARLIAESLMRLNHGVG
jgi:hypothetical protein